MPTILPMLRRALPAIAGLLLPLAPTVAQATWSQQSVATIVSGEACAGPLQQIWFTGTSAGNFGTAAWNGTAWVPHPAAGPSPRNGHAMAFDPVRQRLVLFGGRNNAQNAVLNDLWEFDGTAWQQRTPVGPAPAARFAHAMTWDASRSRIVLGFGSGSPSLFGSNFADLWEWNGTTWSQRLSSGPPRIAPMLGHDPVRGELVLCGGHVLPLFPWQMPSSPPDTYTLGPSASAWLLRNSNGPTRSAGATAFDPLRGVLVTAGGANLILGGDPYTAAGFLGEASVQEWNGTTWATASPLPDVRTHPTMAFDAGSGRMLVVGGANAFELLDTTVQQTATGWAATSAPAPETLHGMAHDPVRGRTVAVEASLLQSRTWEWDGLRWRLAANANATPLAYAPRLAFDPVRQEVLMMTGRDPGVGDAYGNNLWSWNGTQWTLLTTPVRPSLRREVLLATDTQRNVVVLYGGLGQGPFGGGVPLGDHWEWNGTAWTQIAATAAPGLRAGSSMAFDARRGRLVLYGYGYWPYQTDTWEYDGAQWTQTASAPAAATMLAPTMAYDAARERIVVAGTLVAGGTATYEYDGSSWVQRAGSTPTGVNAMVYEPNGAYVHTLVGFGLWRYATPFPASTTAFGVGCAGTAGTPVLASADRPWLGDTVDGTLAPLPTTGIGILTLGFSDTSAGGAPLPLPLAGLGAPGCTLLSDPAVVVALLPGVASAPWSLPLPPTPAFAGLPLFAQGLALDVGANPLGLVTANALRFVTGVR